MVHPTYLGILLPPKQKSQLKKVAARRSRERGQLVKLSSVVREAIADYLSKQDVLESARMEIPGD